MVACMPASRVFVMHYLPEAITGKRSRLTEPYRIEPSGDTGHSGRSAGSSHGIAEAGLQRYGSKRLQKRSGAASRHIHVAADLAEDKNSGDSMRAMVTVTGMSGSVAEEPSPGASSSDYYTRKDVEIEIELASLDDFPVPPGSPIGEYLGVPKSLLTDLPPSLTQLSVSRNVSVQRSSEAGNSTTEAGDKKEEKDF